LRNNKSYSQIIIKILKKSSNYWF